MSNFIDILSVFRISLLSFRSERCLAEGYIAFFLLSSAHFQSVLCLFMSGILKTNNLVCKMHACETTGAPIKNGGEVSRGLVGLRRNPAREPLSSKTAGASLKVFGDLVVLGIRDSIGREAFLFFHPMLSRLGFPLS